MELTLSNKYRPYLINDFHMNSSFIKIYNTLKQIDDLNILFVGGENSGKTSFLYAVIRDYYDIKKEDPLPNTEIMFINNLKEQGINYFRSELMTFCKSKCAIKGKKKLVILDDMDTINEHSQQVFRNYIDKHKNNVNFIGVCSSIQKIIETIQSRLYILKIHSLNKDQILNIANNIVKQENIYIDNDAIDYIICISDNNIRLVINNLEKIYIYGSSPSRRIDINVCKLICSNISFSNFEILMNNIFEKNHKKSIDLLYSIYDNGYSVIDILDYFFLFVKSAKSIDEEKKYNIIPIICKYITIFNTIHENSIELALFARELIAVL